MTTGPSPHPSAPASRPRRAGGEIKEARSAGSFKYHTPYEDDEDDEDDEGDENEDMEDTWALPLSTSMSMPGETTSHHYMGAFFWRIFCIFGVAWQKMASVPRGTKRFQ